MAPFVETPFEEIIKRVVERVSSRRVGFVWFYGEGEPLSPVKGISWVHYISGPSALKQTPFYRLSRMEKPENEAEGLSLLVMPGACARILAEIFSRFPVSPDARFVQSCMQRAVPILLDPTRMNQWMESRELSERTAFDAAKKWMASQGVVFLGESASKKKEFSQNSCNLGDCYLENSGWYSWQEVSSLVSSCKRIILGRGARLTPEAVERLGRLNISIHERR